MTEAVGLRLAAAADLPAITEIYNAEVRSSAATFDTSPKGPEEQQQWFDQHSDRHPVIVAATSGVVLGWGSLSPWSDRCAYAQTAEISVYVRQESRGRGLGRALAQELLRRAAEAGLHTVIARVSETSLASLQLFKRLGFVNVGVMREVGRKFGRLLDVHILQAILDPSPPPG